MFARQRSPLSAGDVIGVHAFLRSGNACLSLSLSLFLSLALSLFLSLSLSLSLAPSCRAISVRAFLLSGNTGLSLSLLLSLSPLRYLSLACTLSRSGNAGPPFLHACHATSLAPFHSTTHRLIHSLTQLTNRRTDTLPDCTHSLPQKWYSQGRREGRSLLKLPVLGSLGWVPPYAGHS